IELIDLPTPEDLPPEVPVVSVRPSGEIELAEHWTPGLRGEKSAVPVELPDREEEALSDRKVENVESQRVVRTKSTRWGAQQLFSAEVAGTPSAPRTSAPSIESAPEGGPLARKGVPIPRTAARSSVGKPPLEPDAPASLDLAAPDAAEPTLPSAPPEQAGPSGSNGDPFSSLLPEDKMLLEELFSSATLSPGSCQVEQLEERPSGGDVSPVLAPLDSAMGFWAPEQTGAPAAEPPEIQATDAIEEEHFELSPTGDEEERLSVEPALSEPRSSAGEAETEGGGSTPWMTVLRGEEGSAEGVRGERRHITAARVIVTSQKGGRGELSRRSKFLFFGGLLLVAVLVIVPLMFGRGMSEDLQEALARTQQSQLPGFEPLSSQRGEIQPQQRKSLDLQTRPGFCYGWIATTSRGAFCDLNLRLYGPGILFSQSTGPDSTPVVFHCATEGIRLQAELENVGPGRCAYGMKSYQRRASVAWPLEPYLDLYSRSLGLSRSGTRWIASSEINHIHMASGERINRAVILPAQDCSYFVAASQQGTNLNLYLRIDGAVVSRSTANNHVAVVSACALDRDLLGELELALVRGESDLVWQSYLGDPPQRR
ncbi:MAG: hypothetical protein JW797_01890, partial [Bradymonadales bacterium]|nr:hypothetical protein [Bradymonadales bacterium]